ncbi:hypothetical protein DL764_001847 [Monosporascus ibericus]|uniref:Ketoreductase (KR) domain-containing protein n=1 Tax=Monosporascus ibericus TaxID=155417 RepID=A0A4Q4TMT6_9PEZI|nr:hypothetical protein DL764_001847 [Monosporascus ibericus]
MAVPQFDITPEKEASTSQYFYRQLFVKPQGLKKSEFDLQGQTAIITGSNTGLGLETSRQLLDLGLSKLILAIEVWSLDLSSYESITKFAERARTLDRLDTAVLSAGIFRTEEEFHPATGVETNVQINYVSQALLTILLLPVLKNSATHLGRLVLVSPDMSGWCKFEERTPRPILAAYKQKSKNFNFGECQTQLKTIKQLGLGLFFLTELAERVPASVVTLAAVNPGFCYGSELQGDGKGTFLGFLFKCFTRVIGRPCHIGARPIVHAAVNFGEKVHGQYVEDGKLRPKAPIIYKPEGEEISKRLWDETMGELSFASVQEIVAIFK